MSANIEIVKKLFEASTKKDFDTVRSLVAADYSLKDPMMELHGPEELVEMLAKCPGGGAENLVFVEQGDTVVTLFDGVAEGAPSMRMCDVITIKNGKVQTEEMFYDTAKIPAEVKAQMEKSAGGNVTGGTGADIGAH